MAAIPKRTKKVGYVVLFILVPLLIYSAIIEPNMLSIHTVEVENDSLFDLFKNKKIVHVSDLHISKIGYRERKLIRMLNEIQPDILFITGDLLIEGKGYTACVEVLKRLRRPPYGIWVVLGNTDRIEDEEVEKEIDQFVLELKELGISVLENAQQRLDLYSNEKHVYILGVEGFHLSRSKFEWLSRGIPDNAPVILLSHYPDILKRQADALLVNLEESEDAGISGWGWQDNSFTDHDRGVVRFDKDGFHTLRVQSREDGVAIEQICLVAEPNSTDPGNHAMNDSESIPEMYGSINPHSGDMIVIRIEDIPRSRIFGSWKIIKDRDSYFNSVIVDMPDAGVKHNIPLVKPEDYFETEFYARGGITYHVWVRMKAERDLFSNDSIYLQFNDSMDEKGNPVYRIGELYKGNKYRNVDIILAGHTHGGQVRIPLIGGLNIIPFHDLDYDMGYFEGQGTKMYVNRGIGTSVLPVRFLCPPEITLLQFTRETGQHMSEGGGDLAHIE